MNDQKRFQVFVSSTYEDLKEERQKVIQSLLELDCFPCGMEYFPAANEEAWEAIQQLISQCDYYVVIVGGKYGSVDSEGISYTEKEYRFALEKRIPVIAFLHADPGKIPVENSEDRAKCKQKLNQFRELCQNKICRFWNSPDDLRAVVTTSLVALMKSHPAAGWVRADTVAPESAKEILQLRDRIDSLQKELSKHEGPPGVDNLAQDNDQFLISFYREIAGSMTEHLQSFSWNQIFEALGVGLLQGLREGEIGNLLRELIAKRIPDSKGGIGLKQDSVKQIIIQLRALDLIRQGSEIGTWILRIIPLAA